METNCAPLIANLFLYLCKPQFMTKLQNKNLFYTNYTCVNDTRVINENGYLKNAKQMYPKTYFKYG